MNGDEHEQGLALFVFPNRRARVRVLLERNREKLIHRLADFPWLDDRFMLDIPLHTDVAALLRERGAPDQCWVMSEDADVDGRELPLEVALERVLHSYMGAFVSCIPGRLGLFAYEAPSVLVLLERTSTAAG